MTIHWKAVAQYFTVVLWFVILENLSNLDLALTGVKGLSGCMCSVLHLCIEAELAPFNHFPRSHTWTDSQKGCDTNGSSDSSNR